MAFIRNNLYAFDQHCTSLSSFFICSLYPLDAFYKSSFFYHYISHLHDFQMKPNNVPSSFVLGVRM